MVANAEMTATEPQEVSHLKYQGGELALFAHAKNRKRYFCAQLAAYVSGNVAEIGAGNGGTTAVLSALPHTRWCAVEPDRDLLSEIIAKKQAGALPLTVEPILGDLSALDPRTKFDTILYIDVLEHIAHDREQLELAAGHLSARGFLVVLAPAYQNLFTGFDEAIGHYRRYTAAGLRAISPERLTLKASFYLDSIGVLTSVINKVVLRAAQPTLRQIIFWDRVLVPISMVTDKVIRRSFGRSVVVVWQPSDRLGADQSPKPAAVTGR